MEETQRRMEYVAYIRHVDELQLQRTSTVSQRYNHAEETKTEIQLHFLCYRLGVSAEREFGGQRYHRSLRLCFASRGKQK